MNHAVSRSVRTGPCTSSSATDEVRDLADDVARRQPGKRRILGAPLAACGVAIAAGIYMRGAPAGDDGWHGPMRGRAPIRCVEQVVQLCFCIGNVTIWDTQRLAII